MTASSVWLRKGNVVGFVTFPRLDVVVSPMVIVLPANLSAMSVCSRYGLACRNFSVVVVGKIRYLSIRSPRQRTETSCTQGLGL